MTEVVILVNISGFGFICMKLANHNYDVCSVLQGKCDGEAQCSNSDHNGSCECPPLDFHGMLQSYNHFRWIRLRLALLNLETNIAVNWGLNFIESGANCGGLDLRCFKLGLADCLLVTGNFPSLGTVFFDFRSRLQSRKTDGFDELIMSITESFLE